MAYEFEPEDDYINKRRETTKACKRKKHFNTEKQAQNKCDELSDKKGLLLYPYQCTFCKKWTYTKASNGYKKGKELIMSLPKTYTKLRPTETFDVFFDTIGPFIKREVKCEVCGLTEPATQRLIVKDGQYVGCKDIVMETPGIMVPMTFSSPKRRHKTCPVSTEQAEQGLTEPLDETTLEEEPLEEGLEPPPGLLKESKAEPVSEEPTEGKMHQYLATLLVDDFPLTDEILFHLVETLDIKNQNVSDAYARGMADLLVRQIWEWRMKRHNN